MESKSVKVTVYGSQYPLKVDDEQLTANVAGKVDELMHTLHDQLPGQPPLTLAVLSALTVSETLYHSENTTIDVLNKVEHEIRSITRFIDDHVEL
jgi:cell division protein ZapA (FtsZ GTPase activity inhibitor)